MTNTSSLAHTGLNLTTPIYLALGLASLVAGGVLFLIKRLKGVA